MVAGKALREAVPRKSQGDWEPADDRRHPVTILEASNAGRVKELVPIRYGRMLQSPLTFYRGAAALMAADLALTPATGLRVQACGDCHLMNFGLFATAERNLVFDVNDLDETLPAPWEWDLKRLVVSAVITARANGHSAAEQAATARACSEAYRLRLREYAAMSPLQLWYQRVDWQTIIDTATDAESRRFRQRLAHKARRRIAENVLPKIVEKKGNRFRFIEDPPLLFHAEGGDTQTQMREAVEMYRSTLSDERRFLYGRYRLEDLAVKVVGIGSVGTRCFVALFLDDDGHPLILQLKEARRSVLEDYAGNSAYANHGQRVVMGQRMMQASSDIFLGWAKSRLGYDFYVRQLLDMKMSAPLDNISAVLLQRYIWNCAWALARAHARSGDAAMISGYVGRSKGFDQAMAQFASAYADQNERDHRRLVSAAKEGRIEITREEARGR
jgi:uncharacterized protein (DUF2252 family)